MSAPELSLPFLSHTPCPSTPVAEPQRRAGPGHSLAVPSTPSQRVTGAGIGDATRRQSDPGLTTIPGHPELCGWGEARDSGRGAGGGTRGRAPTPRRRLPSARRARPTRRNGVARRVRPTHNPGPGALGTFWPTLRERPTAVQRRATSFARELVHFGEALHRSSTSATPAIRRGSSTPSTRNMPGDAAGGHAGDQARVTHATPPSRGGPERAHQSRRRHQRAELRPQHRCNHDGRLRFKEGSSMAGGEAAGPRPMQGRRRHTVLQCNAASSRATSRRSCSCLQKVIQGCAARESRGGGGGRETNVAKRGHLSNESDARLH